MRIRPLSSLLLSLALPLVPLSAFAAAPVEGLWRTIDDETKKPRSHVRIEVRDGKATGTIVKLLNPSEPNPRCTECDGPRKNQPIEGLEILWGLEPKIHEDEPTTWEGGKVLDPENGKIYDAKIWLERPDRLKLRGSVFLFGRTQTWHRVSSPSPVTPR